MKKSFKVVAVIVVVIIAVSCAIAADSRKKQDFHGVEYKLRESWLKTYNTKASNNDLRVYVPNQKKTDTLWIYYIETDKTATDEIENLIPFDDDYKIENQKTEKIHGNNVSIYDVSGYNGLTVQKIAVANGENGLVVFCHNYDADEMFPETKETEKIISSISTK